jgi:hypothetical protein
VKELESCLNRPPKISSKAASVTLSKKPPPPPPPLPLLLPVIDDETDTLVWAVAVCAPLVHVNT